jgi:hypothetical protein
VKLKPPTLEELKDRTLKMEVEHAKRLGLPLRFAEQENVRLLERSEQIAKESKPAPKKKPNIGHAQRKERRGVTTRVAQPLVRAAALSPCGRCGTCRRCKREKRIFAMSQKAKQGDLKFALVLWRLGMYAQQAQDGTGPFVGVSPRDANRMVIRRLEEVCDATVRTMGPWL